MIMVRGRKKNVSPTINDQKFDMASSSIATPVPSKSKRKFKGKLSHSTSISSNKITKYYNVSVPQVGQENSLVPFTILKEKQDGQKNSIALIDEKKVLQETNKIIEVNRSKLQITSEKETNKTEPSIPFSPSTALSKLDLNVNKKGSKIKKRLPVNCTTETNVLKSVNNQSKKNALKNDSENKLKVQNIGSTSGECQTKLTEFYSVRRSVRKTEKTVLEEKRKTLEKAILSLEEDGLEMRIFEGKGRGVVAAKKFQKGEFVVEYAGELITIEEAKKREGIYSQDENTGCYMYYFKHNNNQYCVDATKETNRFGRLLNHSRNGNLCTKTIEVDGIPHLVLIAKKDIVPNCELTYDYGDRSKLSLQYHPWLAQ